MRSHQWNDSLKVDVTESNAERLLIYAPVPLYRAEGQLFLEDQARVGLRLWADNFATVAAMMPVIDAPPPVGWSAYQFGDLDRVALHPLPAAYSLAGFAKHYPATRHKIRSLIKEADVLSFAIGGLLGDWGAVACFTAKSAGRRFAVWTDRVESEVTRLTATQGPLRTRLRKRLTAGPMWALEKAVIRRADLGLFHGRETFDTYAPFNRNPHVVHDILLDRSFQIDTTSFQAKQSALQQGPLQIVYAGRADAMKGPLEWLSVLQGLRDAGVVFHASWLGDGPMLEEMRRAVAKAGLEAQVSLPGFVQDREVVMAALRRAHIFLFCHKTPESPRCLIEALMSGTPIVGYDGAYPRELVAAHSGGRFVPRGDVQALSETVKTLAQQPEALLSLQGSARQDGQAFDQDSVFRHRSAILKQALGGA
ncbi:glycosyltransferase [Shimia sp. R9_1]|uniref:glycosyltransferase n=1 Tax=Shimia sp. R9_1 TaxID=2821111 RepID=UPI001ADAABA2|nr:glycosyltransferase [Shimia sp. R9_1]MBO9408834.1 glycosyltransferase [Shimia sp. R9_1]